MNKFFSKRGYEFSFTWIFAIFVGAAVIFFAIYFAIQISDTQRISRDASEGKSLGALLTPVETQIEEGKFSSLSLTDSTRLYFDCEEPSTGNLFGSQKIKVSIKPPLGQEWTDADSPFLTFHNKYFFPNSQGNEEPFVSTAEQNFYVLSKPLYLPFKVADLLIIYDDKTSYCFLNADREPALKSRIEQLGMVNIILQSTGSTICDPEKHIIVCFAPASSQCDIVIDTARKTVSKEGRVVNYIDSQKDPYTLVYAAIFSDPSYYDCQIKRLFGHASYLSSVYYEKSKNINIQTAGACSGSAVQSALLSLNSSFSTVAIGGSSRLPDLALRLKQPDLQDLQRYAGGVGCELF